LLNEKQEIMKTFNGLALKFRTEKRQYLSFADCIQDLTTDCLVSIVSKLEKLNNQMLVMKELEQRNELSDDAYFDLLETCNGK
jgi:hypothetical protein